MAGSSGQTIGISTKLYLTNTIPTSLPTTHALINTSVVGASGANEVEFVTEVSALEQPANTITWGALGESSERSIAGQTTIPEFTFTIAVDNANAKHKAIQGYAIGTPVLIALVTTVGSGETSDLIYGQIAGFAKNISRDAIQTLTVTVSLLQKFETYHKA